MTTPTCARLASLAATAARLKIPTPLVRLPKLRSPQARGGLRSESQVLVDDGLDFVPFPLADGVEKVGDG